MKKRNPSLAYKTWEKMRTRCLNPNHSRYVDYGGRGITICKEWDNFKQFLADMGEKPNFLYQLDRINNEGNYEPSNCRWVTAHENSRNKRNTVWIIVGDRKMCLADACRILGVVGSSVAKLVERKGMSHTEAILSLIERGYSKTATMVVA